MHYQSALMIFHSCVLRYSSVAIYVHVGRRTHYGSKGPPTVVIVLPNATAMLLSSRLVKIIVRTCFQTRSTPFLASGCISRVG